MADVQKVIDKIIENMRAKTDGEPVYRDEPLIRRATDLPSYVPPKYKEMRKIISDHDLITKSASWIFCRQGKFMEDFEDDYPSKIDFIRYYPTYQAMSVPELRAYFTWRTKLRKGEIEKTSLSFVFIYLYELLNQIGVSSPEDGFEKLRKFRQYYVPLDTSVERYIRSWMFDYVIYYGLDRSHLDGLIDINADAALEMLSNAEDHTDSELFESLVGLSSYNITNSKLYKTYPKLTRAVCVRMYRELSDYYARHRKYTLFDKFFGQKLAMPYYIFNAAVFFDRFRYADYRYTVSPIQHYTCRDGFWQCERYHSGGSKNRELGQLLRACDARIREKIGFEAPLTSPKPVKYVDAMLDKVIGEVLIQARAAKEKQPKPVEIDVSKLQSIRDAADETRDALLVEEETDDTAFEAPAPADTALEQTAAEESAVSSPSDSPLSMLDETETRFLTLLLDGGTIGELTRTSGRTAAILSDAVNEKLYDIFGDTVIDFDGETPTIIDDYTDELKGMLS